MSESYSDWIQSPKSQRVWLEDSMTALSQFAFLSPIHRVRHWNQQQRRRVKCWAKDGDCIFCKNNTPKIDEFTYGIYHPLSEYQGGGDIEVSYLTATLATHTHFQKIFSEQIDSAVNPTDLVFEIKRTKIKTSSGRVVNGYHIIPTEMESFVKEKFRPNLFNSEEQEFRWIIPVEVVEFLKDKDGEPISLIDLFLLLKDNFSGIEEKDLKTYAVKLVENNVLNLRNARERWI